MRSYKTSRNGSGDEDDRSGGLTKDVAFNRRSFGMDSHKSPYDNGTVQIGTDGIEVRLVKGINEEGFGRLLRIAEQATIGLEADDIERTLAINPDEGTDMWRGGLQTALEGEVIAFAVRGPSRTATHQIVRSRRAFFHQSSQRASDLGMMPEFRMPESVWMNENAEVFLKWMTALNASHAAYRAAADADISYQDCRFILPEGTTNFIQCAYTVKEFQAVYAYRACSMFQWEICHIMREMKRVLVEEHPWIESYIKISCELTKGAIDSLQYQTYSEQTEDSVANRKRAMPEGNAHSCTFQGWEQVEHQCDFPWARDSNRTFKPSDHRVIKDQK